MQVGFLFLFLLSFSSLFYVRNLGDAQRKCHQEAGQEDAIGRTKEGMMLLLRLRSDNGGRLVGAIAQEGRIFSGRSHYDTAKRSQTNTFDNRRL
ncbi:hypothetical protein BJ166DRAFT_364949 [Pestalotiopsis sp. NC0098]|nr:hypothetical protein BJ166DRAFT_364949 [Pestalotiopsis sp. NC0098]